MRIFLLRHEIRDLRNPTFYSSLLPEGEENAKKLISILNKMKINLIFTSPFKRVLQTIEPYCNQYNNVHEKKIKVNVEYSLYEQVGMHDNVDINFKRNNFRKKLQKNDFGYNLINKRYKSFLPLEKVQFSFDTHKRATQFFNNIIEKYKNSSNNILISSHEGILLQMLGLQGVKNIPMGGLILCYNDEFIGFNPINF